MPYGLKDEDFDKIQNKIAKKLYEIPSLDRAAFLVGCTEQELREAMTELRKTPKSRGKIEAVERELRNRGNKNILHKNYAGYCGGVISCTVCLGVMVRPSISHRNCCSVSDCTSDSFLGH